MAGGLRAGGVAMRAEPHRWDGIAEFRLAAMWLDGKDPAEIAQRFGVRRIVIWNKARCLNLPMRRSGWDGATDRRPQ